MTEREAATQVIDWLKRNNFEAYAVGGCVRDLLLGREPKDYDVVTSAKPDQVQALFMNTTEVGKQFGIIIVKLEEQHIEVATYRSDGKYTDGRRPNEVTFTANIRDDIARRDFTVNGLVADLTLTTGRINGAVEDVSGRGSSIADLNDRLIRAIGDPLQRFEEDKLRMLRAVRFAVQLDFKIEKSTFQAIKDLAPTITVVSRERVREELFKILMSPDPARGIFLLVQSGLMPVLFPQIMASYGFANVLGMLDLATATPRTPAFMLALLLLWSSNQRAVVENLRLSNSETELVERVLQFSEFASGFGGSWSRAESKRFMRKPYFEEILSAYRLACSVIPDYDYKQYTRVAELAAAYQSEGLWPEKLIRGDELTAWGFAGPGIGKALEYIETLQLNGEYLTRDSAASRARDHAIKSGWFGDQPGGTA